MHAAREPAKKAQLDGDLVRVGVRVRVRAKKAQLDGDLVGLT